MAIQKIEIIDNNKVGDCDLLAVHNPLIYVIKMTIDDSGDDFDDVISVTLNASGGNAEYLGEYFATFLRSDNSNERIYIFQADEILRSGLDAYNDYSQDFNDKDDPEDWVLDEYISKPFYLTFTADSDGTPIIITETLTGVHANRDFEYENGAALVEIYDNTPQIYIGAKDKEVYAYDYDNSFVWWATQLPNTIIDGSRISYGFPTSSVGFPLSKGWSATNPVTDEVIIVDFYVKSSPGVGECQLGINRQHTINNIIQFCEDNYSPTLTNYRIATSLDGHEVGYDESLFFEDSTGWYGYGYALVRIFYGGYDEASDDGANLYFDYTTPDGLTTTNIRLNAKITPTLITDFAIDSDHVQLRANIEAAFVAAYPSLSYLVIIGENYDDFALGFQEIVDSPLGGFVEIDGNMGTTPGYEDIPTPEERNPVFLRKKIQIPNSLDPIEVTMRSVTNGVYVKEFCDDSLYLKYLDKNGQYRFMVCEKPTKTTRPKKIGDIERIVTSLRTDLGNSISVGENGSTFIAVNLNNLKSDLHVNVNGTDYYLDEIALLEDLYNSPDIQLEIVEGKWISVIIAGGGQISKPKGTTYSTTLRLELPKKYNITKL